MHFGKKRILFAALAASTIVASQAHTAELTYNSGLNKSGDDFWDNYTYTSRDLVKSLNEASSALTEFGHHALDLDERTPGARLAYSLIAGQINARFHWANSVYFGHEYVHFQHAHRFGRDEHYFRDFETEERISDFDAYKNIFLFGSVGGPAVSPVNGPNFDSDLHDEEGVTASLSGLNWQMSYSERWMRDAIVDGNKNVFDSTDFLLNRIYLTSYAFGDYQRIGQGGKQNGDVYKFAKSLYPGDIEGALGKIALYSFAANMASPLFTNSVSQYATYVQSADTEFYTRLLDTGIGGLTWDIPQFLNQDSFTLAPTVYLKVSNGMASLVGAEDLLLSASYETPVMGDDNGEARFTLSGNWGLFDADLGISTASGGQFYEAEAAYNITSNMAITAGAALSDGDTLRGKRDLPTGKDALWVGARFTF